MRILVGAENAMAGRIVRVLSVLCVSHCSLLFFGMETTRAPVEGWPER